MVKGDRKTWKQNYFTKLLHLLDEYPKLFIVGVDNVGSNQMQKIRIALRGKAELLMGKNTMIRKAIRGHLEERPELEAILPFVKQNVGFVFTKGDLSEVRTLLLNNKVQAPARAGAIAPLDVFVPPGSTGMGPEKTAFFQALAIPTKIARGVIEIQNEIHLIKAGEKVGASEATLLNMLDISPFQYGCELIQVYDNGETYNPTVLDITKDDIVAEFKSAITLVASLSISIGYPNTASAEFLVKHSIKETRDNIASISLVVGYPTLASAPHTLAKAFKNLLAIAAVTDITFKEAEATKAFLADPSAALAAVAAPAADASSGGAKKEEKKEESEEESSGGGMGMFGDDDGF